jgi:predicted transcriptional regulator
MGKRRLLKDIIRDVLVVLKRKGELSIRSVSIHIRSTWKTTKDALELLEQLGLVVSRTGDLEARLYRIR